MDQSTQGILATSLGINGSSFLTGTGIYTTPDTKPWVAFRSVNSAVMVSGITSNNTSGVNYLVGLSLAHPAEFLGCFTSLQLATGAVQAYY